MRNKMRSVLTVLGITIGIAAVICVVAIGKAGQARVEQQLNNLGDNFVWIEAGGGAVNGHPTRTPARKIPERGDRGGIQKSKPLGSDGLPNCPPSVSNIYCATE